MGVDALMTETGSGNSWRTQFQDSGSDVSETNPAESMDLGFGAAMGTELR